MNHMEEVAHMLGLELYENFRFKSRLIDLSTYEFKFTEDYLMYHHTEGDYWNKASFDTLCNLLNGKYEVIKLPKSILAEEERNYLSQVIKPFRNRIRYICKTYIGDMNYECIEIKLDGDIFFLPNFEKGTLYKGMEFNNRYLPEDLNL